MSDVQESDRDQNDFKSPLSRWDKSALELEGGRMPGGGESRGVELEEKGESRLSGWYPSNTSRRI